MIGLFVVLAIMYVVIGLFVGLISAIYLDEHHEKDIPARAVAIGVFWPVPGIKNLIKGMKYL